MSPTSSSRGARSTCALQASKQDAEWRSGEARRAGGPQGAQLQPSWPQVRRRRDHALQANASIVASPHPGATASRRCISPPHACQQQAQPASTVPHPEGCESLIRLCIASSSKSPSRLQQRSSPRPPPPRSGAMPGGAAGSGLWQAVAGLAAAAWQPALLCMTALAPAAVAALPATAPAAPAAAAA